MPISPAPGSTTAIAGVPILGQPLSIGAVIGLVLALYGTGTVLTSRVVGQVLRRRGETDLILIGGIILTASYLLVAIIPWWPLLTVPLFRPQVSFGLAGTRETFGQAPWHGQETVPQRSDRATPRAARLKHGSS